MKRDGAQIAIVGMSCRFPGGADDVETFWRCLTEGQDLVGEVGEERWNTARYFHPRQGEPGKSYTWAAGLLDNYRDFDAGFFGISPREAEQMDPQQRLLLELVWEALENGGIPPSRLAGSDCGVYVGVSATDFASGRYGDPASGNAYFMTGSALSIVANRISYFYDLHGPSMSIDTACSSSHVALHQACESLRRGESEAAICGAVNMILSPYSFLGFSQASMLSPDGRCMTFDADGRGYVRAEGGGVVMLKRLDAAERDGDDILAVIRGTGVNSDGRTNGIALPSGGAQEALLRQVYSGANVDPASVDYLEAHGTGTAVGDPQETGAIGRALGQAPGRMRPLLVGSVKSNIGHLESGAGMAGLIKGVPVLQRHMTPGNLHIRKLNPEIAFKELNLRVARSNRRLKSNGKALVVGVNSFGFGGTNGHVILEEYKSGPKSGTKPRLPKDVPPLFLSARDPAALGAMAERIAATLVRASRRKSHDVAWNLLHRRDQLQHRVVLRGNDVGELSARLKSYAAGDKSAGMVEGQVVPGRAKVALLFSGNGAQWSGMGAQLWRENRRFARAVREVDSHFAKLAGWSIADLFAQGGEVDYTATEVAQPALFALQVGLIDLLRERGVPFEAVAGHSVGEIAAAYAAGCLSLPQAVRVIYERSRAQGRTRGLGRMAAVGLAREALAGVIANLGLPVEIAAINSPQSATVSGSLEDLERLKVALEPTGCFYRILDLEYAFHSRTMDTTRKELLQALSGLRAKPGDIRFVSTVSGGAHDGSKLGANYWWRNIRKPVRFRDAMEHLIEDEFNVFLEVGPHPILQVYVHEILRANTRNGRFLVSLIRGKDESAHVAQMADRLFTVGVAIAYEQEFASAADHVRLPNYPWQREPFWYPTTSDAQGDVSVRQEHPLLGSRAANNASHWDNHLDPVLQPFLADHVVEGSVVFPAAGFVEMALAASSLVNGGDSHEIFDLEIRRPLLLDGDVSKSVRFALNAEDGAFQIESRQRLSDDPWAECVVGRLGGPCQSTPPPPPLDELASTTEIVGREEHYARAAQLGLDYSACFQTVAGVRLQASEALVELRLPEEIAPQIEAYCLHPALLDGCFQGLFDLLKEHIDLSGNAAYLPSRFGRIRYYSSANVARHCHVRLDKAALRSVVATFTLFDEDGAIVAELSDCRFRRFERRRTSGPAQPSYAFRAEAKPLATDGRPSPMPRPAALAAHVERLDQDHHGPVAGDFANVSPLFDALASSLAYRTISSFGLDRFSFQDLARAAGTPEPYWPLLSHLLEILIEDGIVEADGDGQFRLEEASDLPSPEDIWRLVLADFPVCLPEMALAAQAQSALPQALRGGTGEDGATEGGYPPATLEHYLDSSLSFAWADAALQDCIRKIVREWPSNRRLRILEIGGGDGLIARKVLPLLGQLSYNYVISDVDEDALAPAAAKFRDLSSVETKVLDPVVDLAEHGHAAGAYDLIIAANVLHRQNDVGGLLRRLRKVLAGGGVLAVVERPPNRFSDLIFGIEPTWWQAGENAWSSHSSLLDATAWSAAFEELGYSDLQNLDRGQGAGNGQAFLLLAGKAPEALAPVVAQPGRIWVLLSGGDEGRHGFGRELANALGDRLERLEQRVIRVRDGASFRREADDRYVLRPDRPGEYVKLLKQLGKTTDQPIGIVHLLGLPSREAVKDSSLLRQGDFRATATLALLRALEELAGSVSAELALVTKGAQPLTEFLRLPARKGRALCPSEAMLWGLGRVVMNEHPALSCRMIDLHLNGDVERAATILAAELCDGDREDEVLHGDDGRYVPRLTDAGAPGPLNPSAGPESIRLDFDAPGPLSHLHWRETPPLPPQAGQIQIKVRATGLNFRDVMWAMGVLPDEAVEDGFAGPSLGMECAGEIIAVGEGVDEFAVGDEVMAFAPWCFASHVTTATTAVAPKPPEISFEEAVTIPSAFFTAYYALGHLAQLRQGEKVLIHGAAGGVGLAAIQYAHYCGAEIFATAGSEEKRTFLTLLGVDHVLDSRSLAFADDVLALTGGDGVDVVLNSLAGEALVRSLAVLKPFGRFLELGKRDFFANSKIGLRPFRNNISYFGIDADQLLVAREAMAGQVFREMMTLFQKGVFRPLPYRAFRRAEAAEAFRHMQQSRHIGKIVVVFDEGAREVRRQAAELPPLQLDPDGSYLVSGGFGGFGLATAEWLAANGARSLILIGRSGAASETAQVALERMRGTGVTVHEVKASVAEEAKLRAQLEPLLADAPPLKGVVHAAMVIDDGLLCNLDGARLAKVLAPKAVGAWVLHRLTKERKLDFFVMYSSATTFIGSPGQGSYVAANAYLETLAAYRRQQGLPALAVSWGAISDVGYLASRDDMREAPGGRLGRNELTSAQALTILGDLLRGGYGDVAALDLDWKILGRALPAAKSPKFDVLRARREPGRRRHGGQRYSRAIAYHAAGRSERTADRTGSHRDCRNIGLGPGAARSGRADHRNGARFPDGRGCPGRC